MQKDGSIIISNFQSGTADSAILGASNIVGCDIIDELGVLKISETADLLPGGVNTFASGSNGLTIARTENDNGELGYLKSNGHLFYESPTNTALVINLSVGRDMVVWDSNFTVVSYAQSGVGYIGVIFKAGVNNFLWHPAKVGGLTGSYNIKLMTSQDGNIYYTNGNTIGRITNITEAAGVITVTGSTNVLNLERGVYATTLVELGGDILIGTQKGSSYEVRGSRTFANIYKWDRVSSSFRLPMQVRENGINAMIQKDNLIYFSAGVYGNIYVTNGTNYEKLKTIPFTRIKKFGATSQVYSNAMCVSQRGTLLIGVSTLGDSTPNTLSYFGVYEMTLSGQISLAYLPISGRTGQNAPLYIGVVYTTNSQGVSYSTQESTNYEVVTTIHRKITNYIATYESQLYIVGSRKSRKSYQDLEFTFSEPLQVGQGIKVSYRKDINASWTLIGTWDYSTIGGVISHYTKALIADAELVQIQIKLTQTGGTAFPYNTKLVKLILT